jgi:ATP/ADP translocase
LLFTPFDAASQYKAKSAIDNVAQRAGDTIRGRSKVRLMCWAKAAGFALVGTVCALLCG